MVQAQDLCSMSLPLVCVTGGSGFVANHVCKQLVDSGLYRVRATVRSKSPAKTGFLESIGVEIVEGCDLLDSKSWEAALKGCTFVQHCASPFIINAQGDPQKVYVDPAVNGTRNVLEAARKAGTVKRVVVTSSCAAVTWQDAKSHPEGQDYVWTEDDWQEDNTLEKGPYRLSKRLAEHAAWDFVATHKCFELATICPSFVLGPVLSPRVDAESVKFMKALIDGSLKEVGGAAFGVIDVRNVAQAHIAAMTVDLETPGLRNSHGEARFILSSEDTFPQIEIANLLRKSAEFGSDAWPVPTKANSPPLQVLHYSNERARKFLGVKFVPVEGTLHEGCLSLVKQGVVPRPSL